MFDKIKDIVSDITGGSDLGSLDLGGLEKYLEGVSWPISKDDLVVAMKNNGAPDAVVDKVAGLDLGTINSPDDLVTAFKGGIADAGDQASQHAGELTGQVDAATQDLKSDAGAATEDAKKKLLG
ncbi:MAG TPA: DUF2795 domain-containing protein [Thermomicrobiales bacterium]|nr:DUF2795 domain-containing protein [Thermomicrobiales bacterium]